MQQCNSSPSGATSSATGNATMSVKALAQKVLERNKQCNQSATAKEKQCNFLGPKTAQKLHKVAAPRIRQAMQLEPRRIGCPAYPISGLFAGCSLEWCEEAKKTGENSMCRRINCRWLHPTAVRT
jgi:hypothetical protein